MISFRIPLQRKKVRVVLFKRGEIYYVRWWYRGREHKASTGFADEDTARQRARDMVETVAMEGRSTALLSSLITNYSEARGASESARVTERRLKTFLATVGDFAICAVDASELSGKIQRYLDAGTARGLAPMSVKSDQVALSAFCAFLKRAGHAPWAVNPAGTDFIKTPRVPKRLPQSPTHETLKRVLRAVGNHPIRAVIVLCLSGVRPASAIQRVEWPHINFETKRVITFEKGTERVVALGNWAAAELASVAKKKGRVWPFNYYTAFDCARRFAKEAAAPDFSLQACRRALTNTLQESGHTALDESQLVGHSVQVAEKHYRRQRGGELHHVANSMDLTETRTESSPNDDPSALLYDI